MHQNTHHEAATVPLFFVAFDRAALAWFYNEGREPSPSQHKENAVHELKMIGLVIVAYIFHGIALSILWKWFMVPTLGLPAIPMTQAIGISVIMSLLTNQYIPRSKEQEVTQVIHDVVNPLVAIFVGGIVHRFM